MEPEGVVNALSRIHKALKKDGVLLDLHPTKPFATVEGASVRLGALDESDFMQVVAATEAGLNETLRLGLFAFEKRRTFDVVERFDTADELVDAVADWLGVSIPNRVAERLRASAPPFDIRERVLLQRFQAL
jgi:hypothetical protein